MSQHKQHAWYLHAFAIIAAQSLVSTAAMAQDTPVDLGKVDVVQQAANASVTKQNKATEQYQSYDPVDSGMSVIGRGAINQSSEGGIDTTELLKTLPFVQMDINRNDVTQENMQSIRPSDFSIAGGNYYDNNIQIDGVSATSMMDTTSNDSRNPLEAYGQTSQTLYVNPNLLGNVVVLDSNISARYGNFTGGVVNFELRQPRREFGFDVSASMQNDSMQHYKLDEKFKEDAEDNPPPEFSRYNTDFSVDLPITDDLFLLLSYSRAESKVTYQMKEAYAGTEFTNSDISENFMLKGLYDYSDAITAEAQLIYSPYSSEYQQPNSIDSLNMSDSDGLSGFVAVHSIGELLNWNVKASFNKSQLNRDWDGDRYQWPSDSEYTNWCTSSRCLKGGLGDLKQAQTDYNLNFDADMQLWQGTLAFGAQLSHSKAERSRDTTYYYNLARNMTRLGVTELHCAASDSACNENDTLLTQRLDYRGFDAAVTVNSQALWAEYQKTFGDVDLRGGLRLSHESFLDNYNLAPRFSAAWQFLPETYLTLGVSRYYGNTMLSNAIRAKYPDTYVFRRGVDDNGEITDWELHRHTKNSLNTELVDLDTPYADEYTAALTLPTLLDGTFRVKGILRQQRDQFLTEFSDRYRVDTETGTSTVRDSSFTNNGKTNYRGLALEWTGHYRNHQFNANVTWSKTTTNGNTEDYYSTLDTNEDDSTFVYYADEVISMSQLYNIEGLQNYAAPIRASVGWASNWFDDALLTNLKLDYRGEYKSITDSGDDIDFNGTEYDVYAEENLKASTTVNFNVKYRVFEYNNQNMMLTVKVKNLLDSKPYSGTSSSNPYQKGRSFWIGVDYHY